MNLPGYPREKCDQNRGWSEFGKLEDEDLRD
jgi:hypothetical protein